MRDARYLRAQAELCLEMARQMSDQRASENLRAEAARYHAEVDQIETRHPDTGHNGCSTNQRGLIIAITSPVTGSIFLTGEAAPWEPKTFSYAALKAAFASARYFGGLLALALRVGFFW